MARCVPFPALCALLVLLAAPAGAQTVFDSDFERGDTLDWTFTVGQIAAEAYRFADLDLRDPHLFAPVGPFCIDVTDASFGDIQGLNPQIEAAITTDTNPADGLLDLSLLLLFRPLEPLATGGLVIQAGGACTAPIAGTSCGPDPMTPSGPSLYDGQNAGTCLEPVAGTTSGYNPGIATPVAPCFATRPQTAMVSLGGVAVPLQDAQVAARFGAGVLESGLIAGFLRETDADLIMLPPDLGGGALSSLLPGGSGNCATGNDLDMHLGENGWWFYLNFDAPLVTWTGS